MSSTIVVDSDVLAVVKFMQGSIAASRLVGVAEGIAAMAPLLWERYGTDAVQAIRLDAGSIPSSGGSKAAATGE